MLTAWLRDTAPPLSPVRGHLLVLPPPATWADAWEGCSARARGYQPVIAVPSLAWYGQVAPLPWPAGVLLTPWDGNLDVVEVLGRQVKQAGWAYGRAYIDGQRPAGARARRITMGTPAWRDTVWQWAMTSTATEP